MAFPARASRLQTPSLARRSPTLPAPSPAGDALDHAFARFLRLDVANGDAARETIRSYRGQVGAWVSWCNDNQVDPGTAGPTTSIPIASTWCRTATRPAQSPTS